MATTKTRADLVDQALRNLGVLAAGQSPAQEDYNAVDDHIDAVFASLESREIVSVGDDSQIPVEWFTPLSIILADDAAIEFGLPGVPPSPSRPDPVGWAETKLRELTYSRATGEQQTSDYF